MASISAARPDDLRNAWRLQADREKVSDRAERKRLPLEDSEYVDFSPTEEFRRVIEHITSGGGASA
jgi:hypothetical protein